ISPVNEHTPAPPTQSPLPLPHGRRRPIPRRRRRLLPLDTLPQQRLELVVAAHKQQHIVRRDGRAARVTIVRRAQPVTLNSLQRKKNASMWWGRGNKNLLGEQRQVLGDVFCLEDDSCLVG